MHACLAAGHGIPWTVRLLVAAVAVNLAVRGAGDGTGAGQAFKYDSKQRGADANSDVCDAGDDKFAANAVDDRLVTQKMTAGCSSIAPLSGCSANKCKDEDEKETAGSHS